MDDLAGRTVLVTGGARGIGLGIAAAFAAEGASLVLVDRDEDALSEARRGLPVGSRIETFPLDIRDRDAFARVADEAEARLGPVDVLCANAGVGIPDRMSTVDFALWDHVLGINLGGVVNAVQTFLPRMLDRGGPGHIVVTSSGAGLVATSNILYSTTKFALVGMCEALHQQADLQRARIGVSVLCPGLVRTTITQNSVEDGPGGGSAPSDRAARVTDEIFEHFGLPPEEIGRGVVDAVRREELYVIPDQMMLDRIRNRTRRIVAAMPPETARDRALRFLVGTAGGVGELLGAARRFVADRRGTSRAGRARVEES